MKFFVVITLSLLLAGCYGNDAANTYIINGKPAGIVPYQVSIRINGNHECSGALLSGRHILTAGSCLYKRSAEEITVVTGTNHLDRPWRIHNVESIEIHDKFYPIPSPCESNIALITLAYDDIITEWDPYTKPIKLNPRYLTGKERLTVCGWGATKVEYLPQASNSLNCRDVVAWTQDKCNKAMYKVIELHYGQMCAYAGKKKGLCNFDIGNPLVDERDGINYLVGIASWHTPDCAAKTPDIYTRVSQYREWIRDRVGDDVLPKP